MQEKILLRSIPSKHYMIILSPRLMAKYEGKTEMGHYIQFRDGYAEVTPEELEMLQHLPDFGVDFLQVTEPQPSEQGVNVKVEKMPSEKEQDTQTQRVEKIENDVNEIKKNIDLLAENIVKITGALTAKKEKKKKGSQES